MVSPYVRRLLLLTAVLFWMYNLLSKRFHSQQAQTPDFVPQNPIHIPIAHPFDNSTRTTTHSSVSQGEQTQMDVISANLATAIMEWSPNSNDKIPPALVQFTKCPRSANKFTNHIRLPDMLYNITMRPRSSVSEELRHFWNPTIFSLPSWSENQYLIVSMVHLKDMGYRQNVLCEANICLPKARNSRYLNIHLPDRSCSDEDLEILGPNGGMRCSSSPIEINVPATPAEKCEGSEERLADIAGFHDPRIFYSGRGEPLLMLASQSRYACIGLWTIDLRTLYQPLDKTLSSSPKRLGPGPLISYPTLTELTRNPPESRRSYEKNWLMFSPSPAESYLQYELTSTQRTFSKLIGGGFTTPNLTDPLEEPCLRDAIPDEVLQHPYLANGTWHQSTPALKLVLCTRSNSSCNAESPDTVFFSAIQRKYKNYLDLPIRYERYFVIWSATPPFNMLAISQHPILLANETTTGWSAEETWDDVHEALSENRGFWAHLTYTTTIAYAWGREDSDVKEKGTGYLDDVVILSVGIDDQDQAYGRVAVTELLQCLRVCPGRM